MHTTFPWRATLVASLLYVSAFLLTIMLHELGHALVSKALGGQPVLHNAFVSNRNPHLPVGAELAVVLAGPLLSLGQGLGLLAAVRRSRGTGNAALLALYLGLFGVVSFFGYVMTGPFARYGDIGRAEVLLHWPLWASASVAVAGLLGARWLLGRAGPLLLRFGPAATREARGPLLRALLLGPWALGSVVLTVLSLPAPTTLSLLYPPLSAMLLGAAWGAAGRSPWQADAPAAPGTSLGHLRLGPALVLAGALAVLYRLLVPGVAL